MWKVMLLAFAGCMADRATNDVPMDPDRAVPCDLFTCEGGTIYQHEALEIPAHIRCYAVPGGVTVEAGQCTTECLEGIFPTASSSCAPEPPPTYVCEQTGTCTPGQTHTCIAQQRCVPMVETGSCICDVDTWSCDPSCSDGLCSPAEVAAALVGTWSGMVQLDGTPLHSTTLTIAADGRWSANNQAFGYGNAGGTPGSRFEVRAQTELGASGVVKIFDGTVDGEFSDMRVESNRLRFTFRDSWLNCERVFQFDLTRN